jgi:hypothetical protein
MAATYWKTIARGKRVLTRRPIIPTWNIKAHPTIRWTHQLWHELLEKIVRKQYNYMRNVLFPAESKEFNIHSLWTHFLTRLLTYYQMTTYKTRMNIHTPSRNFALSTSGSLIHKLRTKLKNNLDAKITFSDLTTRAIKNGFFPLLSIRTAYW